MCSVGSVPVSGASFCLSTVCNGMATVGTITTYASAAFAVVHAIASHNVVRWRTRFNLYTIFVIRLMYCIVYTSTICRWHTFAFNVLLLVSICISVCREVAILFFANDTIHNHFIGQCNDMTNMKIICYLSSILRKKPWFLCDFLINSSIGRQIEIHILLCLHSNSFIAHNYLSADSSNHGRAIVVADLLWNIGAVMLWYSDSEATNWGCSYSLQSTNRHY